MAVVESIVREFEGAKLGDPRRLERLKSIVSRLERKPAAGFPKAMGSDAEIEGFYRFINNERITPDAILEPHIKQTLDRAEAAGAVLAVHDTTYIKYSTERDGVGVTPGEKGYGFLAHVTLMTAEADGLPLGVAHLQTLIRQGKKGKLKKRGSRAPKNPELESARWIKSIDAINLSTGVVHVTDAEGDCYDLLSHVMTTARRFVIRVARPARRVRHAGKAVSLHDAALEIEPCAHRTVWVSDRKHPEKANYRLKKQHPERTGRDAKIAIGATSVTMPPTTRSRGQEELSLNVVRVWELDTPEGEPPVEWLLLTTEDVSTEAAIERIVDIYRKRWLVEEYFKAVKTGCAMEKRQVDSYEALCNVLALVLPIAYRLLLLRALERQEPDLPAEVVFSELELKLLTGASETKSMPPLITVRDGLLYIAKLGGHLRHNGPPGWQTLWSGYQDLLHWCIGHDLATRQRSDQS